MIRESKTLKRKGRFEGPWANLCPVFWGGNYVLNQAIRYGFAVFAEKRELR